MTQSGNRVIPGWNEFLSDETLVAGFQDRLHDRWIVDFLSIIEFGSAWIPRCVVMANHVFVLADSANDVAIHHLNVVDIEQQFHVRRANLLDQLHAEVDIIAKVTRMSLHRVRAVS